MTGVEPFVTIEQLISLNVIPVPKDTLYRWAERGVITGYKTGRRWLFRVSEVVRDIERFKNHGGNPIQTKPPAVDGRLARGWR